MLSFPFCYRKYKLCICITFLMLQCSGQTGFRLVALLCNVLFLLLTIFVKTYELILCLEIPFLNTNRKESACLSLLNPPYYCYWWAKGECGTTPNGSRGRSFSCTCSLDVDHILSYSFSMWFSFVQSRLEFIQITVFLFDSVAALQAAIFKCLVVRFQRSYVPPVTVDISYFFLFFIVFKTDISL